MKLKNFLLRFMLMVMAISILLGTGLAVTAKADTDKHGRDADEPQKIQKQYDRDTWLEKYDRRRNARSGGVAPYLVVSDKRSSSSRRHAKNDLYTEECASCHFLFQPWLLPARSWELMIEGNEDHFGEDLALDEETANTILDYLVANSMENAASWNKRARKMLRGLPSTPPASITELPYIKRKHRKIKAAVLARESIKTLSNCVACHKRADRGKYDDDNVKIPKK